MKRFWGRRRIKVLFVQRVPWGGGAERVVHDIASNLDKRRFEPLVFCLFSGGHTPSGMKNDLLYLRLPSTIRSLLKAIFGPPSRRGQSVKTRFELLRLLGLRLFAPFRDLDKYSHNTHEAVPRRFVHGLRLAVMQARLRLQEKVINSRFRYAMAASAEGMLYIYLKDKLCKRLPPLFRSTSETSPFPSLDQQWEKLVRKRRKEFEDAYKAFNTSLGQAKDKLPFKTWKAERLAEYAGIVHGPIVVVAVMEEAATIVRLAFGMRPMSGKPYLVSTHAWESYYLPLIYGGEYHDLDHEKALFSEACQGSEGVTSPCAGCRDDLVDNCGAPEERTICLPNPVKLDSIREHMVRPPEKPLPSSWKGIPYFVCVGRLDPQKRHKLLLQACAIFRETHKNFRLLIIGDGHFRTEIEASIQSLGLSECVHLIGNCHNPFPYMHQAAGLVLTSESESFGLVLVEALACGCVPVAVDAPHAPRDVLDEGRAGFLVTDAPEDIALAMARVLDEPETVKAMVRHGQRHIEQYDIAKIIPQWETLLARTAGQRYNLYA